MKIRSLKSRVKELEDLKAICDGKTLREAEEIFLRSMRSRIDAEARELSKNIIARWEVEEKPRIVFEEAVKVLRDILDIVVSGGEAPKNLADLVLRVRELIESEVKRRMDQEFYRRVEERANALARETE